MEPTHAILRGARDYVKEAAKGMIALNSAGGDPDGRGHFAE